MGREAEGLIGRKADRLIGGRLIGREAKREPAYNAGTKEQKTTHRRSRQRMEKQKPAVASRGVRPRTAMKDTNKTAKDFRREETG